MTPNTTRVHLVRLALLASVAAIPCAAGAQQQTSDVFDQFFRFGDTAHKVYAQEAPGETVDPFTGTLRLVQEDLVLPGKAGLDLHIVRTYSSKLWARSDLLDMEPLLAEKERSVLGYGWSFHMGRLRNPNAIVNDAGCSTGEFPVFEGPDGETRVFYPVDDNVTNPVYRSRDRWILETKCSVLGSSQGACVWSTSGTRYELSNTAGNPYWEGTRLVWPVSAIVDPIGNRISVAYTAGTGAVSGITDTYGRVIEFFHSSGDDGLRLDALRANGKTYSYSYTTYTSADTVGPGRLALPGARRFLTEFRPPAGGVYRYDYGYANTVQQNQYALTKVTSPHGATTEFTYEPRNFFTGRDVVPFAVVTRRAVSGREIPPGEWRYDYVSPPANCALTSTCSTDPYSGAPSNYHVTSVTRPDHQVDTYRIAGFGWVADSATSEQFGTYAVGLTTEVARADRAYLEESWWDADQDHQISLKPYAAPVYGGNCGAYYVSDPVVWAPLLVKRVVIRDGAYFETHSLAFDRYGQATTVTEVGHQSEVQGVGFRSDVRTTTWTFFAAEAEGGVPLNMVRGRPLTQHTCISGECFDNGWTYGGRGHQRDTETLSGVTTTFGYDGDGNLETVTNALGERLTLSAYDHGVPTLVDLNGAYTIRRAATWEGWISQERDGRGNTTTYDHDAIGRLLAVTPPGNTLPTTYEYAPDGRPDGEVVRLTKGRYWQLSSLDGLGRMIGSSDAEGVFTKTVYDEMGNVTFRAYPFALPASGAADPAGDAIAPDGLGRPRVVLHGRRLGSPSSTCDGEGVCAVTYKYVGNCTGTFVQRSAGDDVWTWRCATSYGDPQQEARLTELTNAAGTWAYGYTAAGKLSKVTAPLAQGNRSFGYDANQFLRSETTGESGTVTFSPNLIGQPTSRTDARAVTTTYARNDPLSRVTGVLWGTDDDVTRSYEAHVLKRVEARRSGAVEYGYDELNRVTSTAWTYGGNSYTTSNDFDAMGCLRSVTYPTGTTVRMTCDALNRTKTITIQPRGGVEEVVVADVGYHPSGQPAHHLLGNGVVTEIAHDDHGRVSTVDATRGTQRIAGLSYAYDGAGNVVRFDNAAEANAARTMIYDASDRLQYAIADWQWGSDYYEYDALGNLTRKTRSGGSTAYVYDPATNRLAYSTGAAPKGQALTWDAPGRLAATSDGATYVYDADGRRIEKLEASGATVYHYDAGGRLIAETQPDGTKLRDYVYLGNTLIAVDGCVTAGPPASCTERQWYHTDTLGSVLARTDVGGNVVAQFDYEPWGERWSAAGLVANAADGDRQYNGRVYDAGTGFHDYGARLYWPEIGRFVSADSYLGDPANPASLNRYSYVHNNPYKYVDPTGHAVFLPALYAAGAWCAMGGCQRLAGILAAAVELAPGLESALEQAQTAQQAQASKGGKAAEAPAQAEPATEGARPESLTPAGAGRAGALNEAKRRNYVPTSQQPEEQGPNRDRKGNVQPGRQYKYKDSNGKEVIIRDDAKGHDYGPGNAQNRGPHLNDQNGGHYDYPAR